MSSLDRFAAEKLATLERAGLRRSLAETGRGAFPTVQRGGRKLVSFSCNDYLGLAGHPRVKAAARAAVAVHGVGAGASRLVTGNHALYAAVEDRLAGLKGSEGACVFGSGYLTNIGVIGALATTEDLVLLDELSHACLHAGGALARADVLRFRHNDPGHARELLAARRARYRHVLLATETVFSMDGDRAPLQDLAAVAADYDAWLMSDDAHGFGVVEHEAAAVALQVGTLSKAVGAYGGYCCASRPVVELLKTRARSLVYSTALPPAILAATLAALDIMASEPDRLGVPLRRARRFTALLGLPPAQSAIVPLVLGSPEAAVSASAALAQAGFLVAAIRPPTVPAGTARLRFTFSAQHDEADIDRLVATLRTIPAVEPNLTPRREAACLAFS